jgi:hypothetical protein
LIACAYRTVGLRESLKRLVRFAIRIVVFRRVAEALAIGAAGGLAGLPAGWLPGSILSVAAAAFAGRPLLMLSLFLFSR